MAEAAEAAPKRDSRTAAVEALLGLAAERPWREITLPMIAARAEVSLADLRDLFPSKGAMLAGFGRMIDRKVLTGLSSDMDDQPVRERVLDIMLKRFEAMAPYKEGLKSVREGLQGDTSALLALNQAALNSWRYLLAAAGVDTEDELSFVKLQGAAVVFGRAFETWLSDDEPDLARTMATLDRELKRGEWVMERAEGLQRAGDSLRSFLNNLGDSARRRRDRRERAYSRDDWNKDDGDDFAPAI